jgi:SSS family solute:Na+ symporter
MYRLVLNVFMGDKAEAIRKMMGDEQATALASALEKYGVQFHIAYINWLHYTVGLFILCIAVTIVVSLLTRPPSKDQQRFTYGAATPAERAAVRSSWNGWDILHTAIIIGVIAIFYVYFWKRF